MLKKLSSPQLNDVYQPARDQFNGRGSFGNGGAMRAAPFALAFPDLSDVKGVSRGLLNVEFSLSNGSETTSLNLLFFSAVCPSGRHADALLLAGL